MLHMASTKEKMAKSGNPSEDEGSSKLKRAEVAKAIFCTFSLVLAIAATAVILNIALNAKETAATQFGVGISLIPLKINTSAPVQNMTAAVNGTNVSVGLPVVYNITGLSQDIHNTTESNNDTVLVNITMGLPDGWKKITNIRFNESGVVKNATLVGDQIIFEANLTAENVTMLFDAVPPTLSKIEAPINSTTIVQNLTVESENSFVNASVSVEVNTSYKFFVLYWFNGTDFVDKTEEFNLRVVDGVATFDSFHTSTVLFRLEGTICQESWSCSGWSSSPSCGTRTCTDATNCGTTNTKPAESLACTTTPAATGGGGGGGGSGVKNLSAAGAGAAAKGEGGPVFSVDKAQIRERVSPGELKKDSFTITNIGKEKIALSIQISGVSNIVSLDTSYIELKPGASHTVGLLIVAEKSAVQGVHTGIITVSYGGVEKRVSVIVEVEPPKSLFDIIVTVNPSTKTVLAGNTVIADISLFNLVGSGKFDVIVRYGIIDYNDKLLIEKRQTVAVETRAGIIGTMDVPRDSKPGTYSFFAATEINGADIGLGSDTFEVINPVEFSLKEGISASNVMFVLVVALLVITLALVIFSAAEFIAHHFPHSHIGREMGAERAIARHATKAAAEGAIPDEKPASQAELEKKLRTLEAAFDEGMISVRAYIEDKVKIQDELKKNQENGATISLNKKAVS